MPRNISFAMTTRQFLDGTKTVTRRLGWENLRAGDELCAIEKGQGLKKGEKVKRLGMIRVINVRREPLDLIATDLVYGRCEVDREGFPGMGINEFVMFFVRGHKGCTPQSIITRIEFKRVPTPPPQNGKTG